MKEQYVGDISDYRKYTLLRSLMADGTTRVGVCWMLTPSDGSTDGNKLAFLLQPEKHRHFDPELFDILAHVAAEPDRRRLQLIEDSGTVPGARYFNAPLGDNAAERRAYMATCLIEFASVDLVFFDPDNGLPPKRLVIGHKNSAKFVFPEEVRTFHEIGKSVLIYQHFARVERETFIATCVARLRKAVPNAPIWAFRTKDVVFLLLIHPDASERLREAARDAASRWDAKFIVGRLYEPDEALPPVSEAQAEAAEAAEADEADADMADAGTAEAEDAELVPSPEPACEDEIVAQPVVAVEPSRPSDDADAEPQPRPSLLRRLLGRLG